MLRVCAARHHVAWVRRAAAARSSCPRVPVAGPSLPRACIAARAVAVVAFPRTVHGVAPCGPAPGQTASRALPVTARWASAAAAADDAEYTRRARAFLQFLRDGVEDMLGSNPDMTLELTAGDSSAVGGGGGGGGDGDGDGIGELRVFVSDETGTYTFQPDVLAREVVMISPISGVKRYAFSERHDAWLDTSDDHHCIQLFTHELIGKCKGYPAF